MERLRRRWGRQRRRSSSREEERGKEGVVYHGWGGCICINPVALVELLAGFSTIIRHGCISFFFLSCYCC